MSTRPHLHDPRLWVLVIALVLVSVESGLSRFGGYGQTISTLPDERLGWRKAPGRSTVGAGGISFRTNSLGYRDREWAEPAEEGLSVLEGGRRGLRIAVLGDSMHYGPALAEEDLWARRLEVTLAEDNPARDVLVMNFAVVGYVFEQMARVWEDQVHAWRPDVLVIGVNSWVPRPMRYFGRPEEGPFASWVRETALYDCLQDVAIQDREPWHFAWEAPSELEHREGHQVETSMRKQPLAPKNELYWRLMFERLQGLERDLESRGGQLVLLSVPRLRHVLGESKTWGGGRWEEVAGRLGVVHVDLLPDFRMAMTELLAEVDAAGGALRFWNAQNGGVEASKLELREQSLFLFSDPEHLSARGQALVAERMRDVLGELDSPEH